MSKKKYPLIGAVRPKKKNTCAKCKCGETAKFMTEIQVNYFRGDDDVLWSCDLHKKDVDFLLSE